EILIIGNYQDQIKFNELTLDMFRLLHDVEGEPTESDSDEGSLQSLAPSTCHRDLYLCDDRGDRDLLNRYYPHKSDGYDTYSKVKVEQSYDFGGCKTNGRQEDSLENNSHIIPSTLSTTMSVQSTSDKRSVQAMKEVHGGHPIKRERDMEGRELDPIRFKAYPNEILDCYASDNGVTTETKIADKLDRIIDNTGQILTRLDVVLRQMYELSEYTYGPCIQYMITVFKAFGVAASFIVPQLADVQQIPIPDILKDGNFWKDFATKMDGINEAVSQIMIKTTDLTMHQECYQAYEGADLRQPEKHLKRTDDCRTLGNLYRTTTDEGHVRWPQFGFLFDIDGVLTRGRKLLPYTREAFRKLVDFSGNFRIPTVFVTNAGNELRSSKATKLSHILGIQILPEQVIMSHSPLKLYTEFHKKHCLITGQGPIAEIAKNLGFTKVTTTDQLCDAFPNLDMVDHKKRRGFVRWETNLQLVVDVLMTNGNPSSPITRVPSPHLPVLASNADLLWMAEAPLPRFGHGSYMFCLENVYKKISGHPLQYTAIVGKPSEITYYHAEYCVSRHAQELGIRKPIKRLYAVG
ncbi:unnamed protein product, partial [Didymodactylos carnosus]